MKTLRLALSTTFSVILIGCWAFQACAGDWPQFRGPGGLGIGDATSLPAEWSGTKNVVWKAEIPGAGSSSPVVFKDRVYLTYQTGYAVDSNNLGDIDDLKRHVLCIDAKSGKIRWKWQAKSDCSNHLDFAVYRRSNLHLIPKD